MRLLTLTLLVLTLGCVGGCGSLPSEALSDDELRRDGQWTDRDALARYLLDMDSPESAGTRPTRLAPLRRKLISENAGIPLPRLGRAAGIVLGLDYEVKYQYVAAAKSYVLLGRDRPPTIVKEDPHASPRPPEDRLSRAARRELQNRLASAVQAVFDAAARADRHATELTIEP